MTDLREPDFEPPVPGVERLPRAIEPARDLWPGIAPRLRGPARRGWMAAGALAAAVLALMMLTRRTPLGATRLEGRPRITRAGVTTDDSSSARLTLSIGQLDVEPETDLRLVALGPSQQRFALRRGTISARVNAPPRVFVVETPAAIATDLGCAYVLRVDSLGNGTLHVTLGQVELAGEHLVIVPAGYVAAIRSGRGPGTPVSVDAPPALVRALDALDAGGAGPALDTALRLARPGDARSLWNLIPRVAPADRGRVYDALARLASPPAMVTRAGVVRLDRGMLELWWNYLPWVGERH